MDGEWTGWTPGVCQICAQEGKTDPYGYCPDYSTWGPVIPETAPNSPGIVYITPEESGLIKVAFKPAGRVYTDPIDLTEDPEE